MSVTSGLDLQNIFSSLVPGVKMTVYIDDVYKLQYLEYQFFSESFHHFFILCSSSTDIVVLRAYKFNFNMNRYETVLKIDLVLSLSTHLKRFLLCLKLFCLLTDFMFDLGLALSTTQ